jgi:heterotetrameric sarcosine oxidase gamma subunit
VSVRESRSDAGMAARLELRCSHAAIVELAAHRGRTAELTAVAAGHGRTLPSLGRAEFSAEQLALSVRPERWLVLQPREAPATAWAQWAAMCGEAGTAVNLSSGLAVLQLCGPAARAALARSCRLDLDLQHFPAGRAAATIVAQVSTVIVAMPRGLLLLTPSTTARHFCEWLLATGRPFGIGSPCEVGLSELFAE